MNIRDSALTSVRLSGAALPADWLPLAIGIVLCGLAVTVMTGWILRIPGIVNVVPGHGMTFNSAVGFMLAALVLFVARAPVRQSIPLQTGLAAVIAALFALIFFEHLSGIALGID